jgi:hypothetical protein
MNVASQARAQANKNMDRAEQVERLFGRTARDLMEGFFDGGWSRDIEGNGREERGPLLGGWYGGLGWRREGDRYDGTSESSGRTTVVHREDCEGQCGVQSRRRSGASEER